MEQDASQTLLPGVSVENLTATPTAPSVSLPPAPPRLRTADRAQVLLRPCSLEELLEADHPARTVWAMVERWDLSAFLAGVLARGESPGRASTDPKILVAVWLFAYTQNVGGGRELDRLCESHDAYRWLTGGVSLNYHTLNDFRVQHEKALDDLLTQMIGALTYKGLVSVKTISQDGTRQRAGAGRSSFKTRDTLQKHLDEAKTHVEEMKHQADDPAASAQKKAAVERAARERVERIEQAIQEVAKVEEAKAAQKEKPTKHQPAKASETDPEARQMRMPGGGTAPGYNIQFGIAVPEGEGSGKGEGNAPGRAIVGVDVTNAGSDVHESQGMRKQVEERTGRKIEKHLIDGGYVGLDEIAAAAQEGVSVYAPVPKPRKEGVDPHAPKKTDSPAVREWRQRMGTPEAKELYKQRCSTCETANAECKTYRGLRPFLVRGLKKVRCIALWSALAYNLIHFARHLVA
jgi:transposase